MSTATAVAVSEPGALGMLLVQHPRDSGWVRGAGLLPGDWGTARLYVLGLAFLFAQRATFPLVCAMSGLMLAVGWAYGQIARVYPDGGGVYTAARRRSRGLAVTGMFLLCADYVVTAALSAYAAVHYFNAGPDATTAVPAAAAALVAIAFFNLLGPKQAAALAVVAAAGLVAVPLLTLGGALPPVSLAEIPRALGAMRHEPARLWVEFVAIVLVVSGVDAIATLAGIMTPAPRPPRAARRSVWTVAAEVAAFNVILGGAMAYLARPGGALAQHAAYDDDVLALVSINHAGRWAEAAVRGVGGVLLLSAANTATADLVAVLYLLARDGEMPAGLRRLNRFGVPWAAVLAATAAPCMALAVARDGRRLADLYAVGVAGAVAINVCLCAAHPRLRRSYRKGPMFVLGGILLAMWAGLCLTKGRAAAFVAAVIATGLLVRWMTRSQAARRGPTPSLLRLAVLEELAAVGTVGRPRIMIGTFGSDALVASAVAAARDAGATLVVCFVREVSVARRTDERKLTIDTDGAAVRVFARYLEAGRAAGVPVLPVYDSGDDPPTLLAEQAAAHGCTRMLIGSSRRTTLHRLIKGRFQRRLEAALAGEINVEVVGTTETPSANGHEPSPVEVNEDGAHVPNPATSATPTTPRRRRSSPASRRTAAP